ncbi:MAG: hypothetical protein UV73_C0004G0077 [Candidatus Gottesmanbacteria bacterium GW2011_GWA2_43_14]|uniref:Uncharacterized protein n=1 Tax=Candidatus Gottesmanbacteria bacterium GW2011_GWA2_43_14 TaxID=1618443 RepID=A0A0G1DJ89_9BACT|nr:MAG: hypothetical protein UV73_C0004G0077 [Candidatus Gottesmanbacteria bacterium GW2011_GWA2_43_14]
MSKKIEFQKAVALRKKGLSIKTIAKRLKISSSSASRWCKNVELTSEQKEILLKNSRDPFYGQRKKHVLKQIRNKEKEIKRELSKGIKDIGNLTKRELFLTGVGLYWAEGFKKDRRLGFANSDPKMIKLFLKWLTECCDVSIELIRLSVGLNLSHSNRIEEVQQYWSEITKIPLSQFQKPFFQKFLWKKKFSDPENYYGVLRIRVNKQLKLFRRIAGWIEGLKLTVSD